MHLLRLCGLDKWVNNEVASVGGEWWCSYEIGDVAHYWGRDPTRRMRDPGKVVSKSTSVSWRVLRIRVNDNSPLAFVAQLLPDSIHSRCKEVAEEAPRPPSDKVTKEFAQCRGLILRGVKLIKPVGR